MANCKEYSDLSIVEQYQLIGKLCHLAQNHAEYFIKAQQMVRMAEKKGLLNDVVILPKQNNISELQNDEP